MLWLIAWVAAVILGTVVVIVAAVSRHRSVKPPPATAPVLPDFAVVDCGEQIHFVPLEESGHVLGSARCRCQPRRTANRRRSGGRVVYVDHQTLAHVAGRR